MPSFSGTLISNDAGIVASLYKGDGSRIVLYGWLLFLLITGRNEKR